MQDGRFGSLNEMFENTKGVIRIRKSKKDRQHNDQKKKDKQRSTKHTYETKDRVTRTQIKTGMSSGAPKGLAVPAPLVTPVPTERLYICVLGTSILSLFLRFPGKLEQL